MLKERAIRIYELVEHGLRLDAQEHLQLAQINMLPHIKAENRSQTIRSLEMEAKGADYFLAKPVATGKLEDIFGRKGNGRKRR